MTRQQQLLLAFLSAEDKIKLDGIAAGATNITVDSVMSDTSTNPVQNKIIYEGMNLLSTGLANHTHDERYYQQTAIDTLLSAKANVANPTFTGNATFGGSVSIPNATSLDSYLADGTLSTLIRRNAVNNILIGDTFNVAQGNVYLSTNNSGTAYVCRVAEDGASYTTSKIYDQGNVGVTLWEGSFSSGSITVEGLSNYTFFRIKLDSIATSMFALRNGNVIRGGGLFSSGNAVWSYGVGLTRSGDTLTYLDVSSMSIKSTGVDTYTTGVAITRIDGLF